MDHFACLVPLWLLYFYLLEIITTVKVLNDISSKLGLEKEVIYARKRRPSWEVYLGIFR